MMISHVYYPARKRKQIVYNLKKAPLYKTSIKNYIQKEIFIGWKTNKNAHLTGLEPILPEQVWFVVRSLDR